MKKDKDKDKIIKVKTKFGDFDCWFESNQSEKGYTVTVPKLKGKVTVPMHNKESLIQ